MKTALIDNIMCSPHFHMAVLRSETRAIIRELKRSIRIAFIKLYEAMCHTNMSRI